MKNTKRSGRSGRKRDVELEGHWRSMLAEQQESGLGPFAFCELHSVAVSSFYWWRREIQRRDNELGGSGGRSQRRRTQANASASQAQLVPVVVTHGSSSSRPTTTSPTQAFEIAVGDTFLLRVPPGFDGAELRRLLAILAERC